MFSTKNKKLDFGLKDRMFEKKAGSSKQQANAWLTANKKRNEQQQQPRNKLVDDDDDDDDGIGVMLSADSSPRLQSLHSPNYVELPEEPRPGKITPGGSSSPSPSTPSPRASKSDNRSSPDEEEAIEEAVPIVRSSLPSPEPRPELHNGYGDRLDGVPTNGSLKPQPQPARDVDDDSCLIKCVYFTQQCCECVII